MSNKIGRQTPTNSYIIPYKNTRGNEAIELYNNTTRNAMEWQEIQMMDIMAVDDDGQWVHIKYGYSIPRRNGKSEILVMRELWGLLHGEKILHTAHRTGSLTVVSNFSLTKSLKTLIISMLLSFFIVKFVKINVLIWANVCYNRHRR